MPYSYLLIFAVVFAVNLLPAFGPPTWSILILYRLHLNVPIGPLVLIGASAATGGRLLLALTFRHLSKYLSEKTRRNLAAARTAVERRKRHAIMGLAFFVLSPLPSAQLFEAAGLARIRLLPVSLAFFVGRIVSYWIYASTVSEIQETSLGDEFQHAMTSPLGMTLEALMLVLLVVVLKFDWEKFFTRSGRRE